MSCKPGLHHKERRLSVTELDYGYYDIRYKCDECGKTWVKTERGPL